MGAVFAAIGRFFTDLLKKITDVTQWVIDLVLKVFESVWHVVTDLIAWAFEGFLAIAVGALNGIDLSEIPAIGPALSSLPGEVVNVLGLLGLGDALAIVTAAILIRIVLQLIPFTRLGS